MALSARIAGGLWGMAVVAASGCVPDEIVATTSGGPGATTTGGASTGGSPSKKGDGTSGSCSANGACQ